jgi:dipeptidyl aminopeptidase/acylaminoacyl peptidase
MPRDPRISPDGRAVVFVEEWNDRSTDAVCSNLWLVSTGGGHPRRLTDGPWRDRSPRWSPDGTRVAWISGRGGVRILALDAQRESAIEGSPLALAWSPDGRSIAYTARVAAAVSAWAPPAILPMLVPGPTGRTAIFVVPSGGGPAGDVTGVDLDALGEPAWTRDGKSILSAAADGRIYAIRLAGGGAHRLTDSNRNGNPVPSPDGARIAWVATDSVPHSYSIGKLYVMNTDGSHVKLLAGALDRDPACLQWSSDSRTVYFIADDAGATHVYAAHADGAVRQVTGAVERLRGFTLADNGRAAAVRTTGDAVEVVAFPVDMPPATATVLASPMAELLAARETAAAEEIRFPSAGKSIQGWMIRPPRFDRLWKYPLLLDIADAPRRMLGPAFSLRAQIFAARGWVVLRVNPRGTPGYGEEFGRLLPTRYPGDDADDLLAAVDFAVAQGGIDTARVAVSGGLLTAWLIGHSDRFGAAVARRPIVDFALAGGRAVPWMGAEPWENPEQYARHSPLYFAQNWKTPTLVLAGEHDPQADEFYAVLQRRKVDAAMVRVPDGKPSARVAELESALAWLGSALKAGGGH